MVNKKGWLKIVEASFGILIILGVILVFSTNNNIQSELDLTSSITDILTEVAKNSTMREQIVANQTGNQQNLEAFVAIRIISPNVNYSVKICEIDAICGLTSYPPGNVEVYAAERLISSSLSTYNPKKIKIFVWRTNGNQD